MHNGYMISCLSVFLFLLGNALVVPAVEPATLVFKNGVVYTVDKERSVAEAVAVQGETIVYVGDDRGTEKYVGSATKIVDLNGRLLIPGFMDGHHHVAAAQKNKLYEITLHEGTSVDDYTRTIRKFADDPKNADLKIVHGSGWVNDAVAEYNKSRYGENTLNLGPKAELLDEILAGTPLENVPVTLNSSDEHSTWANTKALEIAKLLGDTDTPNPKGGKIERDPSTGKVWGTFRDEAGILLTRRLPPVRYNREQFVAALKLFERELHSYGITGVMGPGSCTDGIPNPGEGELYEALKYLEQKNELGLIYRLCSYADPERSVKENVDRAITLRERHVGSRLMQFNTIKIFADGVIEDRSGYLLEPYADNSPEASEYRGRRIRAPEAANELAKAADANGFQVHVHAIGDAACREFVDAVEAAVKTNGKRDSRHTITHLQLVVDADIDRMANLGIVASVQPYWFAKEPLFFGAESRTLGTDRAEREYPMRKLFEYGLVVAGSSDSPVTDPPNPLTAIETGVTRCAPGTLPADRDVLGPDERVSRAQMIECFTINVAKQLFVEEMVGSIEPGKLANLVILERNILDEKAVPDWEIAETSVSATYFLGVRVHEGER